MRPQATPKSTVEPTRGAHCDWIREDEQCGVQRVPRGTRTKGGTRQGRGTTVERGDCGGGFFFGSTDLTLPPSAKKQTNQFKGWPLATAFVKGCVGIIFLHQQSSCIDTDAVAARTRSGRRRRRRSNNSNNTIQIMSGTRLLIISYHLI
jgi:hypothetical protein